MRDFIEKVAVLSFLRKNMNGLNAATKSHYFEPAAEIAGLGMIAAPELYSFSGKDMDEDKTRSLELAGLGTLAVPSALHIGRYLRGHKPLPIG